MLQKRLAGEETLSQLPVGATAWHRLPSGLDSHPPTCKMGSRPTQDPKASARYSISSRCRILSLD